MNAVAIKTEAKCFDIYRLALWSVVSVNGCRIMAACRVVTCQPAVGYIFWRSANENGSRNDFAKEQAKEALQRQTKDRKRKKDREIERGRREGGRGEIAKFNFSPSAIALCFLNRRKYWSSFFGTHPPGILPLASFPLDSIFTHLSRPSVGL